MLKEKIQEEVKESMKARDSVKTDVLRGILAAFTNELVATKRQPSDSLADEEEVKVVQKLAKQRKDSIEQYRAGGRDDLVEQEKIELTIVKKYLPQMMERNEIKKLAIAKQTEMSLTDPSKKGMLMGAIMKDLKGKADGGDVKNVVDEMFG